ncbi:ankyrin repeat domain-containing protein [Mucilaginibacter sp. HMF5004]|uniref:ankyrin repeat domain-containing protein n=1 Tax=Mucilaginibacter rivuli TaxID=2857527 RepID=UPI001C5F48D1|nr:ankyrin repeat domain-containing protein [Mucilaginibacter rivuli]MBW4888760.1 ankyrin repeat domain-containing protein [Mucilaginibacter rivuli]
MKKILIIIFTISTFVAQAQKNVLLDQSFWQTQPDVAAIKAEIEKGSNPLQSNAMSMDAVVMAINAQAPNASIEYLLSLPGSDVNKLTHDGRTYLHWAATRGNVEITEYLLNKGAKINIEDSHGTTPLTFAAGSGQQNTKIYDLLAAHGADLKKEVNEDGANVLLLAVANDKELALTNYFVSKGIDLNSKDAAGNNVFGYAAKSGNVDLLKTLLQKGVKPNANAMLMAAQGGGGRRGGGGATLATYQYLESLGIKPTATAKNGENVLHALVRKQNQNDIIQYFITKGVDVNQADEEGNTAFMNAASANRDTAVLALLLPNVKNINQANLKGATALTLAVRNSADVMNYLIAKGANVNVLDKTGNNLAYYVIEAYRPQGQGFGAQGGGGRPQGGQAAAGQAERQFNAPRADDFDTKLQVLKDKGLNIIAPQKNGNTLYHLAVAKNDVSLLKRLEPFHIDINSKNNEGLTALHKAALIAKDDVMLKYLLSIGAKKDAVTNFKETAFDLAAENESLSKNNVSVNFLK